MFGVIHDEDMFWGLRYKHHMTRLPTPVEPLIIVHLINYICQNKKKKKHHFLHLCMSVIGLTPHISFLLSIIVVAMCFQCTT